MYTDENLHHRVVLSGDGVKLGDVTRLIIDPQGFRIAALEVRLQRDVAERLGMAHGMFRGPTIQIPTEHVQSIGDAIILSITADRLISNQPQAESAPEQRAPAG